jgi:Tfp pilus assembly protein PilE
MDILKNITGGIMADKNEISSEKKFSLVELLMIILLVGIIFTIIVPLNVQKHNHQKIAEAVYNLQLIASKDVEFYNNPENGYYAFDVTMLNIDETLFQKTAGKFIFDYTLTDSTVVATTNADYGVKGAQIFYYLPRGPWALGKDKVSESTFDPVWLP